MCVILPCCCQVKVLWHLHGPEVSVIGPHSGIASGDDRRWTAVGPDRSIVVVVAAISSHHVTVRLTSQLDGIRSGH